MNILKLMIAGVIFITLFSCKTTTKTTEKNENSYQLIWSDEFDTDGLPQSSNWTFEEGGHGWGNGESQFYVKDNIDNSYCKDGKLHIVVLKKEYEGKHYTSARMITYQKFSLKYGKIEARAKIPRGKGTWPAIWMLPESIKTGAERWPACGEIDIMEHVGKDPNVVHHSLHTELYNHIIGTQMTYFEKHEDVFDTFHKYTVEWTENLITFYVDDIKKYEIIKGQDGKDTSNAGWPFDKPYFIILNVAIGGGWGGDIDPLLQSATMEIDYIRVYQKNKDIAPK